MLVSLLVTAVGASTAQSADESQRVIGAALVGAGMWWVIKHLNNNN